MPTEIYLVKVGMTMTEGIVDEWYVADGEPVEKGEPVYRLETEKVNMDVEADVSGIVKHIATTGETLAPGDVVGWIFALDEAIPDELPTPTANPNIVAMDKADDQANTPKTANISASDTGDTRIKASPAARRLARERNVSLKDVVGTGPGGRIVEQDVPAADVPSTRPAQIASPAARRLAKELDVDLSSVHATGPRGRITKDDVVNAAQAGSLETVSAEPIPLKGMRKVIAERMYQSLQSTAQLTIEMEVCMDDAIKLRGALIEEWESSGIRVTYTDLIVAACVKALPHHANMNATLVDGATQLHSSIHVGIAVALEDGLIVPVLHDADRKSLKERALEAASLAERAKAGALSLDDVNGGTFTVTSLGMYGVDTFTPILNAPQVGILGVGRIYDGVRWDEEHPTRTQCLRLSLTWDHRALDGAPAAEFLSDVKDLLESPYRLVI